MKQFNIPLHYRSSFISKIKESRKMHDLKKKDYSPTLLNFGPVRFYIARHFGFCYGVENAIEISYKTIEENPDKRIFLLSEMIHNPGVNDDLIHKGVRFLMDTSGNKLPAWDELKPDDIVIIPAFGTTLEIQKKLGDIGINPYKYNTTCPFVEKVWNRSNQLGGQNYTVIIHGKHYHEETRATFSHSTINAPSLIVKDMEEAKFLAAVICGEKNDDAFYEFFNGKYSGSFNVKKDLQRLGVVNQTTMLAAETQAIADYLKDVMINKYGEENIKDHFADTRDTLCYATNDNQQAAYELLKQNASFAIVVGGYNSSNTGHIVGLCREKLQTYFISNEDKIISKDLISHFDLNTKTEIVTKNYLSENTPVDILLTSGASCPDAVVDKVVQKIISFYSDAKSMQQVLDEVI